MKPAGRPGCWARRAQCLLVGLAFVASLSAGEPPSQDELDRLVQAHARESFSLFRELLSLPNDAHYPEAHLRPNLEWMTQAFRQRGFETRQIPTGGFPLLLAERPAAKAATTVLVYLQIDGQPVDPSRWRQEDAWSPVLKERDGSEWREISWSRLENGPVDPEWRIFARSASDAKGPVGMFLTALDAFEAGGFEQSYHLKVIMDFEEELGSPFLPQAVIENRDALAADMLIIFDGPRHYSNRPSLTFGARGIATIELEVFGPRAPQHSGHFGNYAPNPALRLAQLLASMKDEEGRVTIPGYYDGVELDEQTLAILAEVPDDEEEIRRGIGIAEADGVASTYQEAIQFPSLNVRGMSSGWVGEQVRTIVPSSAVAEIDVRLTPESDPEHLIGLIRDHVMAQGYHLVDGEPTEEERRPTCAAGRLFLGGVLPGVSYTLRLSRREVAPSRPASSLWRGAGAQADVGRLDPDLALRDHPRCPRGDGPGGQLGQQPAQSEREPPGRELPRGDQDVPRGTHRADREVIS